MRSSTREPFKFARWTSLGVAALFFAWLRLGVETGSVFEFDPDEGNNLIKALLLQQGVPFGEIWSDQPPGFTYLLRAIFALTGPSTEAARSVVAAFSSLIVFVVCDVLRRRIGVWGALAGAALLVVSDHYVRFSVSVMIGIPAIAMACASLWCIEVAFEREPERRRTWIAASGALMGAGLAFKLFIAPLVFIVLFPLAVAIAKTSGLQARMRRLLQEGGLWAGAMVVALLLGVAPALSSGAWTSLVGTHVKARSSDGAILAGLSDVGEFIANSPVLYVFAAGGLLLVLMRRDMRFVPQVLWLGGFFVALSLHSPVWRHHCILLSVPAAMLGGYGVHAALTPLLSRLKQGRNLLAAFAILTLLAIPLASKDNFRNATAPRPFRRSDADWDIFEAFSVPARHSKTVVTSRPSHAFRAGRHIPPQLSVTSVKRFRAGLLSSGEVIELIEETRPKTILLSSRWPEEVREDVRHAIKRSHLRVAKWRFRKSELWVEKKLAKRLGLKKHRRRKARRTKD